MTQKKQIRIRCVGSKGEGIVFYVEHESEHAIHIDNRAKNPSFHTACTLVKLPNGNLANSAGHEYEVVR